MKNLNFRNWLLTAMLLTGLFLHAQDYQIGFAILDRTEIPDSIKVENLDQGTMLTMNGDAVLYLLGEVTQIDGIANDEHALMVYPNPMNKNATVEFYNSRFGLVNIRIVDLMGRTIAQHSESHQKGALRYNISGLSSGTYVVNIIDGQQKSESKLISSRGRNVNNPQIEIESFDADNSTTNLKSTEFITDSIIQMQYNEGETLKFTAFTKGVSSTQETIITQSQTLDFYFLYDIEDNVYPIVTIGNQTWMAKNLMTTKYNDGTAIPYIISEWDWTTATTPGYCWFEHNEVYADTNDMGAMYNWFVVETGNLCPEGWHVPSRDEFQEFVFYMAANGYNYDGSVYTGNNIDEAGEKIGKSMAVNHGWVAPTYGEPWAIGKDQHLNNSSGFNGVGGSGRYMMTGVFGQLGYLCNWWTSTPSGDDAWTFFMYTEETMLIETYYWKQGGYNVRCLKDEK